MTWRAAIISNQCIFVGYLVEDDVAHCVSREFLSG
jgi:hypothetical protein